MKVLKISTVFLLTLISFCGCDVDYYYYSTYIFENATSEEIIVSYYSPEEEYGQTDPEEGVTFIIPIRGNYKLTWNTEGGFAPPFMVFDYPGDFDYVVVSKGEKEITFLRREGGKLYDLSNYKKVSQSKLERKLKYTFTEQDFID